MPKNDRALLLYVFRAPLLQVFYSPDRGHTTLYYPVNTLQSNKLTMYENVLDVMHTHAAAWKKTPIVAEAVKELEAAIPQIRKAGAAKATSLSGVTTAKGRKKSEMAEIAYRVAGLAGAYAAKADNDTLREALHFTRTQLAQSKDNTAIDRCTAIHDQVRPLLAQVEAYGVTAADLDALKAAIAAFQGLIRAKGQQRTTRTSTMQSLTGLFTHADTVLKVQLDKLMLRYEPTHREFFEAYVNSRVLRKVGGNRKAAPVAQPA